MSEYIKINSDNSIEFLGNQLFNSILENQIFYTGNIPNGDFFIWDDSSETILEDFDKRKSVELSNIRNVRDQLLKETDWMVIKSLESGEIDPEWIKYRQELRDLPSQYSLTGLIDFPDPPISGLHEKIEIEQLQPYTLNLINQETQQDLDWGDWEGWKNWSQDGQQIEPIESGSGIDPKTMTFSGITGQMDENFDRDILNNMDFLDLAIRYRDNKEEFKKPDNESWQEFRNRSIREFYGLDKLDP